MAVNLGFSSPDWAGGNPFLGQGNPYLQQQIDASLGDTVRNYNMSVAPTTSSAMVRSGSFGNSGLDQMQQEQQRQLAQTLGNQANNFRAQDYNNQQQMYQWDQGFNRALYNDAYSQNANNLQMGLGLLNTLQGANQSDLTNATNIQNTPLNYYGQFSNIANSIGQGYGTSYGSSSASGSPLTGALGGWQLGGALQKAWGNNGTGGAGGWGTGDAWGNQDYGSFF